MTPEITNQQTPGRVELTRPVSAVFTKCIITYKLISLKDPDVWLLFNNLAKLDASLGDRHVLPSLRVSLITDGIPNPAGPTLFTLSACLLWHLVFEAIPDHGNVACL